MTLEQKTRDALDLIEVHAYRMSGSVKFGVAGKEAAVQAILAAVEEERGSKAEAIIRECEGFGYSRENVRHILHVAGYVTDERLPPLHTPPSRVSVPPEPTEKMIDAAPHFPGPPTSEGVRTIYRAMIAAAQEEG